MELKFYDTYKTVPTYIVWVDIGNGISFIIVKMTVRDIDIEICARV